MLYRFAVFVFIPAAEEGQVAHVEAFRLEAVYNMSIEICGIRDQDEVSTSWNFVSPATTAGAHAERALCSMWVSFCSVGYIVICLMCLWAIAKGLVCEALEYVDHIGSVG
jgi:hypothetical protein